MSRDKTNIVGERITTVRTHFGLTKKRFAEKLDVSDTYISFLESGKREKISDQFAHSVAYRFGINPVWLLRGEGKMFLRRATGAEDSTSTTEIIHIPLYNVEASAGAGEIPIDESVREYIPLKISWLKAELRAGISGVIAVPVSGDSMKPTMADGDLVLIEKTSEIRDDAIYVFRRGDHVYVKRLQALPGGSFEVISDNAMYKPYTVDPAQFPEYSVIGRVIWHGRNL